MAAFGSTQASFLPKKAILRLDRVSQHSASFAVTTRSGVLHRVLWPLLTAHRNSGAFPINSFENWKQNLLYTLSLDSNFAPFLADGFTWLKKTKAQPLRGLESDRPTHSTPNRSSKSQLSRTDARSNCQLLPHYFTKYPGEELNLSRVHLANYSTTLWIPSHWRTIYRLFRHTPCSR